MFQNMIRAPKAFEELLRQCAEEEKMAEPRLQHNSDELRAVANLLDTLNNFGSKFGDIGLDGELAVYWIEVPMGKVVRDGDTWAYYPEAAKE